MQAHLLLVGPIPATIDASASSSSSSSISRGGHNSPTRSWSRHRKCSNKSRHHKKNNKRGPTVVVASSSSSWAAFNGGEQDHHAVLGLERTATSADIKKAYRLLARKYHPDVSKHSQACELFKSVRHVSYAKRHYHTPEVEDWGRIYKWAEMKQKIGSTITRARTLPSTVRQKRRLKKEVLRSAFLSLFLLQTLGSLSSLTFSSLMALFDRQLDAGVQDWLFHCMDFGWERWDSACSVSPIC